MINLLKKSKKVITLALSILMVLSVIPAGIVFAAETKVVVDLAGTHEAVDGEVEFSTFAAALNAMYGSEPTVTDHNNTIYVVGEGTYNSDFEGSDYTERSKVIVTSLSGAAADATVCLTATTDAYPTLKGDIEFQNITLYSPESADSNVGFSTGGKTVTLGTGTVRSTSTANLKYGRNNASALNENLVIDSATLDANNLAGTNYTSTGGIMGSTVITVNNAKYIDSVTSWRNGYHGGTQASLKKNFTFNLNGGTVHRVYLGGDANGNVTRYAGDIIYNINGGKIEELWLSDSSIERWTADDRCDDGNGGKTSWYLAGRMDEVTQPSGNIAVVIDTSQANVNFNNWYITNVPAQDYLDYVWKKADTNKRYALVFNNYDIAKKTYDTANADSYPNKLAHFDYKLFVTGGAAYPVYKEGTLGDPSTSYLQGFVIEPRTAGMVPVANGQMLTATTVTSGTYSISGETVTASESSPLKLYDLSSLETLGTNDVKYVEFLDGRAPVVVADATDNGGLDVNTYKAFTSMNDAIAHLGTQGGTVYVRDNYGSGISDITNEYAATANIADGNSLTITSFPGSTPTLAMGNGTASISGEWLHCNLVFKNIIIETTHNQYGFFSNGNTITFGEGVTKSAKLIIATQGSSGENAAKPLSNNVIINNSDLKVDLATSLSGWMPSVTKYINTNITLTTGTITSARYLLYGDGGNADSFEIGGDYNLVVNGGTVDSLNAAGGGYTSSKRACILGDVTIRNNGGRISGHYFDGKYIKGNATSITNHANSNGTNYGIYNNEAPSDESKKFTIIQNNATTKNQGWSGHFISSGETTAEAKKIYDYLITTVNGETETIFKVNNPNVSAYDKTLVGFTINPTLVADGVPAINGKKLTAKTLTQGEYIIAGETVDASQTPITYYDLSAYEHQGIINIEFMASQAKFINYKNPLNNTSDKLEANEQTNVVFFGGSVTAGTGASAETCWRGLTMAKISEMFPSNSSINYYNVATGESGTTLGLYRTANDIISKSPDLLFIEYSINDKYFGTNYATAMSQFETIIREVKTALPNCEIVTVLVTDEGASADAYNDKLHIQAQAHKDVSDYYGITSLEVGLALAQNSGYDTFSDKAAWWDQFSSDIVHLNATGNAYYFAVIEEYLDNALGAKKDEADVVSAIPAEICSANLADGNRAQVIGGGTWTTVKSDAAATFDADKTLANAVTLSGNASYDAEKQINVSSNATYTGAIKIAAGTTGTLTYTFTGTEFAIYGNNKTTNDTYKYKLVGKNYGRVYEGSLVIPSDTGANLAKNPVTFVTNMRSDEYTVTLEITAVGDIYIPMLLHRDASKQTGDYNYGNYWIKYGGTGNGSSPEAPAPSYAYLVNKVISKVHTADETVNVFVMQDDAEIYYNSIIYANGGEGYAAEYVGNFADTEGGSAYHHMPENHFTALTDSQNNAFNASHTAKVVIQSYDDGDGDKNYFAYSYKLGFNNQLFLAGPTEFKNISLLSVRGWTRAVVASGYDVTINDGVGWLGILVDEYGSKTQWDGTIRDYDNDESAGDYEVITGDYYNHNWNLGATWGEGGNIVLNKEDDTAVSLGGITGNKQFDKATNIYFNAAAKYTVSIVDANQTFSSLGFVANNDEATISFNVPSVDGLAITDGVQIIADSSLAISNEAAFFEKFKNGNNGAVKIWKLIADNSNGTFLDLTDTIGTFKVTNDSLVAIANNTETGETVLSENGELILTAGTWNVQSADISEKNYINFGKTILALTTGEINLLAEDINVYTAINELNKAFMGWVDAETGIAPENGTQDGYVKVTAGQILKTSYINYNSDSMFTASGVQMRNKGDQGLRFVLRKYNSLETALEAAGATFNTEDTYYGALILATSKTEGKDMFLGEPIYTNEGSLIRGYGTSTRPQGEYTYVEEAIIGTPAQVKGVNTWATGTEEILGKYTEYTVVVDNMASSKYARDYSVQGYIQYFDVNGIERVVYSEYYQANHYNTAVAIEAAYKNDTKVWTTDLETMVSAVKTYVNVDRKNAYDTTYTDTQTDITNKQGIAGLYGLSGTMLDDYKANNPYATIENYFKMYELSNGLRYINFNFTWQYTNEDYIDYDTATELVQMTDNHLNYYNSRDFIENLPSPMSAYNERVFNCDGASAKNTMRAIEFSSWANKIILTGDIIDTPSWGNIQLLDRLVTNAGVNKNNVLTVMGNHDDIYAVAQSVADDKNRDYYRARLTTETGVWSGDLDYHAEIVFNDNGKNPVYVVTINNGYGYYTADQQTKFTATIADARAKDIPVIVYQHKPIMPNDGTTYTDSNNTPRTNVMYFVGGKEYVGGAEPNQRFETALYSGWAASSTDNAAMYNLFLENADIIQGIFCGHEHSIGYTELQGTGSALGHTIPQLVAPATYQNNGWATKVNVTAANVNLVNTKTKLANGENLTVGYVGGSITNGYAIGESNIAQSYVNQTSAYLDTLGEGAITTLNAGVSGTQTALGLYRYEDAFSGNTPDLVFVEFTTNDWNYSAQNVTVQQEIIESLFRKIWAGNPKAEIVAISTNTGSSASFSYKAYKAICDKYGVPLIDVGKMITNTDEQTVDGLHPNITGYNAYMSVITPALETLLSEAAATPVDYNAKAEAIEPSANLLVTAPNIYSDSELTASEGITASLEGVSYSYRGTALTPANKSFVAAANTYDTSAGGTITATFSGKFLSVFAKMGAIDASFTYSIDGGEAKTFTQPIAQSYAISMQQWVVESDLEDTTHTVVFTFAENSTVQFAAVAAE